MARGIDRTVAVAGVGYAQLGRSTGRTEGSLAIEAVSAALDDAGVARSEVDGLATFPDRVSSPFEGPSLAYLHRALGLGELNWYAGISTGSAQFASVVDGIYATAAGAADVVVCYRAHLRQRARFYNPTAGANGRAGYLSAFRWPYGAPGGAATFGVWAQRFLHDNGYTEHDLAEVVLNNRANAQLNPRAAWYGKPLSRADYFAAEYIATPLRIVDCDYPVDGAVAVVLVSADRAAHLRHEPTYVRAIAHGSGPAMEWDQWPDMSMMTSQPVARQLWSRTALTAGDVDVAELYDGFSWFVLAWLQDLGLCEPGGAGEFLRSGTGRTGGALPVCTDGGQLGEGRLHGMGKLAEATLQLQGRAAERQVPGAEVAVATAGGGHVATAILLSR